MTMTAPRAHGVNDTVTFRPTPECKRAILAILEQQRASDWRANQTTAITAALVDYAARVTAGSDV